MANMMDYLEWRGDLTFRTAGFNEVDNMLLAQLVYVDLDGIVAGVDSDEEITIKEASKRFWSQNQEEDILARVSMTKSAPFLMRKMAETKRFRNVKLSRYVNDISDEEQSQFSVLCAALPDNSIYVAFSGTDETIVGWRENFNMSYLAETPGQQKAVEYIKHIAELTPKKLRIGGHSKGGNLSVYAAVKCDAQIQDRIVEVYSNDGPGLKREIVKSEEYQRMLPKIKAILPESSIVGMLLEHQDDYKVVKSTASGVAQHDAMSWEVLGTSFVYVENVAPQSIFWDETMKAWGEQVSEEEWREMVETVFSVLDEANIRTIDDFYHSKWKVVQDLLKVKSKLPEETMHLFSKALKTLWSEGNRTVKKTVRQAVIDKLESGKDEL